MPTPFYHLRFAESLLEQPELDTTTESLISRFFPAFLLGHVAPDVQVVSGQTRQSTHFYNLPIDLDAVPPWQKMLDDYPSLSVDRILAQEQSVFVSGYLCHLQADWFWADQIFEPYFGPLANWKSFRERLYLHNVLRAYLDFQILENLSEKVRLDFGWIKPRDWLPFVLPDHLQAWQEFLADQLKPGAKIQTIDVFAERQGISTEAYYRMINSEKEMQRQIFDYLPRQRFDDFWDQLIEANLDLLSEYLVRVEGVFDASV